jgi:hypothetical protein
MLANGSASLECHSEDVNIDNVGKKRTVYEHFLNRQIYKEVLDVRARQEDKKSCN